MESLLRSVGSIWSIMYINIKIEITYLENY